MKRGPSSWVGAGGLGSEHIFSWGICSTLNFTWGRSSLGTAGGAERMFRGRVGGARGSLSLESDSSRDPESGSCPSFCLERDKGTGVGRHGSRLHPADSVPEDPCPSPGSPKTAWLWSRGSQKGPIYDSWTPRQGCVLMSSPSVFLL